MSTNMSSKFISQIKEFGINPSKIHRNLSVEKLLEAATQKNEGMITSTGSLSVKTGKYTGRSPDDRFIVFDDLTHDKVHWAKVNKQIPTETFEKLSQKMKKFVDGKELYIFDGFVGADPENRLPIRVINDHAWQSLFVHQLLIRPSATELESHEPEFTIICINDFEAIPEVDGTSSNAFILINLSKKLVLIGTTNYAGEIKKAIFSVMNFILPSKGVFPMHCSANIGKDGDTSLFFGLSGTGKTSLSADPQRMLIGDDEHGWSDKGIFNFEGGCYAKCINLKEKHEPQIWNAVKNGAVLENVVINKESLKPDFDDGSLTENTRAAYPLDYIPGAVIPSVGGNPKVIIFLTADAMGVLPPLAKLSKNAAMFHFMSGYTSKLAGTEIGVKEPKAVFSKCFGAPFMPRPASVYAEMLGEKISKHNTSVYLINTGWSGGPYGVGERIKIEYSRAMVTAALTGSLDIVKFSHNDIFNLDVPTECPNVPSEVLEPRNMWIDKDAYDLSAKKLAQMFVDNFKKFENVSNEIRLAGPKI
ncbi:MAG: phosphoenolpyruvate carboxykinase (ATP) [Thaumarchaeota archaeon]|nr:MAG: phosphoenolpyruvate carboxykinase (ATP) [Nitrososphaerota archaeon]HIA97203.1 phosphoenolpyruvate carboxykinase (ATP) [Candidatus Nitrosopelagicus sp.]HIO85348.1 phosphoenolpyruvate carboxykinase (ATP) [Candidatus Nitrosopelagicus sp.]